MTRRHTKKRHLVENFFCDLKEYKKIAMRSEKTDESSLPIILFGGYDFIAVHRKFQTRRVAEDSALLYGEATQHSMRLSVDGYKSHIVVNRP